MNEVNEKYVVRIKGYAYLQEIVINLAGMDEWNHLTEDQKKYVTQTFTQHSRACGLSSKMNLIPFRVVPDKDHVKIYMVNGDWFHYYSDGDYC